MVEKEFKLQRFQAKGGWTYATIPVVKANKNSWIYSAKKEETRIEGIAATINKVSKGLKFASKSEP